MSFQKNKVARKNGKRLGLKSFKTWLKLFMKDRGLAPTLCGTGSAGLTSQHKIDVASGNWANVSYSMSKPIRWLFRIHAGATGVIAEPATPGMTNIGLHNTASGDKAVFVVRILPVIEKGMNDYEGLDEMEVNALFAYKDPIASGGSAETTAFDAQTGDMQHKPTNKTTHDQPYIFAALLGDQPPNFEIQTTLGGQPKALQYQEVLNALSNAIKITPTLGAAAQIPIYNLTEKSKFEALTKDLDKAYTKAGPPTAIATKVPVGDISGEGELGKAEEDDEVVSVDLSDIEIIEDPTLVGIDPAVYRQINAALRSHKQHIMFYGPPGTGKTTLARWVATSLAGSHWTMITGSADWSSQDIIGGYQPVGDGKIKFFRGALLRDFDRPLIIDELNRCDIDKVIGPLFTVLSSQQTTLPYRINAEDPDSAQFVILPVPKACAKENEFAPGQAWRLIATINSIDKASLYQMSYALSRRFGWVYVDVPKDTSAFLRDYFKMKDAWWVAPPVGAPCPLGEFWAAVNEVRAIGPAPIIDAVRAIRAMAGNANFFVAPTPEMRSALLDSVDMVLLPMLDGIIIRDADKLAEAAIKSFVLEGDEQSRIKERMRSVAV